MQSILTASPRREGAAVVSSGHLSDVAMDSLCVVSALLKDFLGSTEVFASQGIEQCLGKWGDSE